MGVELYPSPSPESRNVVFHAIAAMSENRAIGYKGKIPWHIREDFLWFKYKTMGGTLIMGRKTFESIGKALPGRKTIVLTRRPLNNVEIETCPDAAALKQRLIAQVSAQPSAGMRVSYPEGYEPPPIIVPWVCGGAEVYSLFLTACITIHLTRIKRKVDGDTFFPAFENDFQLEQVIHENQSFRVERWFRKGWTHYTVNEPWPFAES